MATNVIWVDANVDNCENTSYKEEMKSMEDIKLKWFKDPSQAIDYLKQIKFEETKIIISWRLYAEFIENFVENIKEINVVPKIIIFTGRKSSFIKYNQQYANYIYHDYYNYGGIQVSFLDVKKFLADKSDEKGKEIHEDDCMSVISEDMYRQ